MDKILDFINSFGVSASGGYAIAIIICMLYTLIDSFCWIIGKVDKRRENK